MSSLWDEWERHYLKTFFPADEQAFKCREVEKVFLSIELCVFLHREKCDKFEQMKVLKKHNIR